jgi:calcineurin-like phosphoesterase family protein
MTTFFASDFHLGHRSMIERGYRKPGYEERILKAWSHIVRKDDVVYLLGDVAFTKQAYWFERLQALPGEKHLICGNHDRNRTAWYQKWGFVEVLPFPQYKLMPLYLGKSNEDQARYGLIMLSHVPAFLSVGAAYDSRFNGLSNKYESRFNLASCILNIHGHTHAKGAEKHNTFDVGVDVVGEQLVSLEQIIELKFKV